MARFGLFLFMTFVSYSPLSAYLIARTYNSIIFDINCGDNLKLAADANTVELAKQKLDLSLEYLEKNKMTEGFTSVLWKTPSEDVGFWYSNLKSSQTELSKITTETSQLEKSNVLMKLRETLTDHGEGGIEITLPSGISVFPNTMVYFIALWLSLGIGAVGTVAIGIVFYKDLE